MRRSAAAVFLVAVACSLGRWRAPAGAHAVGSPDGPLRHVRRDALGRPLDPAALRALSCEQLGEVRDREVRCMLANEVCSTDSLLNYRQLYHCHSRLLIWPLFAGLAAVLLYLLGDIAETHFCPALEYLSEYLGLAPAVAGPTLLALGNGAPDISSSLIGLVVNPGAQDLGLNSPLGGGLFVISVVVALVISTAKVEVERWPFFRDAGAYLLAVLLLAHIVSDGLVFLGEAAALLALYAAYVGVVVWGDRWVLSRLPDAFSPGAQSPGSGPGEVLEVFRPESISLVPRVFSIEIIRADSEEGTVRDPHTGSFASQASALSPSKAALQLSVSGTETRALASCYSLSGVARSHTSGRSNMTLHMLATSMGSVRHLPTGVVELVPEGTVLHRAMHAPGLPEFVRAGLYRYSKFRYKQVAKHNALYGSFVRGASGASAATPTRSPPVDLVDLPLRAAVLQFLLEDLDLATRTGWRLALAVLMLPVKVALHATIPLVSDDAADWRKLWAVTCPTASPLLFLFAAGLTHPGVLLAATLLGLAGSFLVYHATHADSPPKWAVLFSSVAFIMSIVWIYLVANELLGLLEAVGGLLAVSQPMLAVTVLAWGNCIGDVAADLAMAQQGYATTAVCATYGGPLLTLCVGLGSAFACQAVLQYPAFPIGRVREDVAFCLFSLVTCLGVSLVCIPLTGFRPGRGFSGLLLGLYGLFFLSMVGYEQGLVRFNWLPFPSAYAALPSSGHTLPA
eukprot:EG_transcript_2949